MKHWMIPLVAAGLLTACNGDAPDVRFGPGSGGGEEAEEGEEPGQGETDGTPIAEREDACPGSALTCIGDVVAVEYDSGTNILEITGLPFDETPVAATYDQVGVTGDFAIYMNSDPDEIDDYTALYADSPDGSVSVGVVGVDGYRFGYKGGFYRLNSPSALPNLELAEYSGTYRGLMDFDDGTSLILTGGDMYIAADFTDNVIKGAVTGRGDIVTAAGGPFSLPDIILFDTALVDGTFNGRAESYILEDVYETGSYVGLIGGTDAETVGGIIEVIASDVRPDIIGYDPSSRDTGAFIVTKDP